MLQMFHLDVAKVDRGVARRGRWPSLCGARVPVTDAGAGAERRDVGREAGCGRGSGAGVGAASGRIQTPKC